jgi:hypothetical protein
MFTTSRAPCLARLEISGSMTRYPNDRPRYEELRRGRRTLALLAPLIQLGFVGLGFGIFLDQSRSLLSDAQFTWGERQVLGITAIMALGGCGFAGWIIGRLIKVAAEIVDVLADGAESALRTNELIEQHLIPTLARVAKALETKEPVRDRTTSRERP